MVGVVARRVRACARARARAVERRRAPRSRAGSVRSCRRTGPALANMRAAFPDKSEAEMRAIAPAPGRISAAPAAEYPHLGQLFDYDHYSGEIGRIEVDGIEHFIAPRATTASRASSSRPISPTGSCRRSAPPATGSTRRRSSAPPTIRPSPMSLHEIRSETMGGLEAARQGAAFAMQGVLERGGHLGMLIDQHFTRGVTVDFIGRPALINPILGKFARRFDCPVHGVRVIRLPDRPLPARAHAGARPAARCRRPVDVQGAMQAMTARRRGLGARASRSNGSGCTGAGGRRSLTRASRQRDFSPGGFGVYGGMTLKLIARFAALTMAWLAAAALAAPGSAGETRRRSSSSSPARAARPARRPTRSWPNWRASADVIALQPAGRLLGLSRLEGHARPAGLHARQQRLFECAAATGRSSRRR